MKLCLSILLAVLAMANANYGSYRQDYAPQPAPQPVPLPQPVPQPVPLPQPVPQPQPVNYNSYGQSNYGSRPSYGQQQQQPAKPMFAPQRPSFVPQRPTSVVQTAPRSSSYEQQSSYGQQAQQKVDIVVPEVRQEVKQIEIQVPREEQQSYGSQSRPMIQERPQLPSLAFEQVPQRPAVIPQRPAAIPQRPTFIPQAPRAEQSYGQAPAAVPQRPTAVIPQLPRAEQSYGAQSGPMIPQAPRQEQSYGSQSSYGAQSWNSVFGARAGPVESSMCLDQLPGTKLANSLNPSQFFVCLEDGEFQLLECPIHTVFNTITNQCETTARATAIGECKPDSCENGGTCLLVDKKVVCECPFGTSGTRCQLTDACLMEGCGPNSVCINLRHNSEFRKQCICDGGKRIGPDCINAEPNPCLSDSKIENFPSSLSKKLFYQCDGDFPHWKTCAEKTVYRHETQSCDWEFEEVAPQLPQQPGQYRSK